MALNGQAKGAGGAPENFRKWLRPFTETSRQTGLGHYTTAHDAGCTVSGALMNPQSLEIAGNIVALIASLGGTLYFLSTFDRWCTNRPARRRSRAPRLSSQC